MNHLTKTLAYFILFYGLVVTVFVLSLLPIEHPDVSPNDKVNHFMAYGMLTVFGFLAHSHLKVMASLAVLFGVGIELLQGLTAYRLFSFGDILANTTGVIFGCTGILLFSTLTNRINKGRSDEKT